MLSPILRSEPNSKLWQLRCCDDLGHKLMHIHLDDVARGDYAGWSAEGLTPSLDTLATQAIEYQNYQGAPVCSPDRCSSLVGADPYRTSNLGGRVVHYTDTWAGPAGTWVGEGMPGYRVVIGKIHYMGGAAYPMNVLRGCDEFHGVHGQMNTQEGSGQFNFTYYSWWETSLLAGGTPTSIHYNSIGSSAAFNTNVATLRAIDAVNLGAEYIRLNYNAVHLPVMPPPPQNEPPGAQYVGGTTNEQRVKEYMRHLDFRLGEIIAYARSAGYVVILTSDNGQPGSGKGTMMQSSINCLCFVWGPGITPKKSTRLVCAQDTWATVRELRGASIAVPLGGEDSWSFVDDLYPGEFGARPARETMTIDTFAALGVLPDANDWLRSIRNGRYQLIVETDPSTGEVEQFYDLIADPQQLTNLAGNLSAPQKVARDRLYDRLPTVP